MKAGLTIEELATEVMRQKDAKADYIVNTSMLAMEHCGTELVLRVLDDSHIDRIEPLDQGRIEKGLAIDEQLAALGIHPADLDLVLLSHLDCDHTNGLNLVADAKQILVSKDELLFAENKTPVNRIRYNADWWRSTKMQTFDWNGTEGLAGKSYDVFGDESLVMVNIPGHSKGLCALKITGSDGRFILLLRRWRLRPKIVGAADHIRHCR